jgi:hypothetical protein
MVGFYDYADAAGAAGGVRHAPGSVLNTSGNEKKNAAPPPTLPSAQVRPS